MHAAEVMDRAEAGEVRQLVGAAVRAVVDVVRMRRRPRALRIQTEPAVARERLFRYRPTLSKSDAPGVDEVLGDGLQAFARRQPPTSGLSRGSESRGDQDAHANRDPHVELAARAHLPLLPRLVMALELDAGHRPGDGELGLDGPVRGVRRDEPGLLVRDPSFAQRISQRGQRVEAPLQPDALLDGALAHVQPLLTIMDEGGESGVAPEPEHAEEHGEVAEHLVPATPQGDEAPQLLVEQPRVLLHGLARYR